MSKELPAKAFESLMNIEGEKTPAKLKQMMVDITFELIQHPEQYWLLEQHAHFMREVTRAFDCADSGL